jgi:hypothetical protein
MFFHGVNDDLAINIDVHRVSLTTITVDHTRRGAAL